MANESFQTHTRRVKSPEVDLKLKYPRWMEIGLLSAIVFVTVVFQLGPGIEFEQPLANDLEIVIEVQDVPVTRQITMSSAPLRPVIPIASDIEEEIIEDETEFDASDFSLIPIPGPPSPPSGKKSSNVIPPKQIVTKFPDYPDDLRKKGISGLIVLELKIDVHGKVIDHRIRENTTNNDILTDNAVKAAYKGLYKPASDGREPVVAWTKQVFEFDESTVN